MSCADAEKLALLGGRRVAGGAAGVRPIGVGRAVAPHRVHDHRELAGHRHHRLLVAALGDLLAQLLSAVLPL